MYDSSKDRSSARLTDSEKHTEKCQPHGLASGDRRDGANSVPPQACLKSDTTRTFEHIIK